MGRLVAYLLLFAFLMPGGKLSAQSTVSDLTLVYDASISSGDKKASLPDAFDGATTTVYISGAMSSTEMVSTLASFTSIHDARSNTSVVLQEISGQKLLIRMSAENLKEKNKKYEGIVFTNSNETRTIAGYKCTKATATLKDGSSFTVYYTRDIVPENTSYDVMFKNLKGIPLEYELSQGTMKIKYTVSKISLNPVPASRFDIPKSGYRELTYEESRKLGIGGK